MKKILTSALMSAVFATSAFAQTMSTTTTAPAAPIVAPTAPTAPVVQPVVAAPAGAAATTSAPVAPQNDLNAIVSKLGGNANSQQKMGQVMVIGSILGCTQKTVGKPATEAFYQEMQTVGKTAEGYCKQGHATEARSLLLTTFNTKQNDPVVKAGLNCYDAQTDLVSSLGGPQVAADATHYARWLRDPKIAQAEMKESDICRNTKKVN